MSIEQTNEVEQLSRHSEGGETRAWSQDIHESNRGSAFDNAMQFLSKGMENLGEAGKAVVHSALVGLEDNMRKSATSCGWQGGGCPYGYTSKAAESKANEGEAPKKV